MPLVSRHRAAALARANQYLRIQTVHRHLADGRLVSSRTLAREFEVSARTCKRDIETLRDKFGAPIRWDGGLRSYVYTKPYDLFEHARLTAEEAIALALASKAFAAWGTSSLGRALEGALGKLTDALSDHASLPLSDIEPLISQAAGGAEAGEGLDHFQPLLRAIKRRVEVRLDYRKPSSAQAEERVVRPLHLALMERRWVLLAFDSEQEGIRKFVLSRIQSLEIQATSFEPPPGFDAAAYLRGAFGHYAGESLHAVAIRIAPDLAPFIAEKKWHPSQRLEPLPDGGLIVRYELSSLEDIRRWILGWGGAAEALEPAALKTSVANELKEAARLYE